jgi:hypothetical protein
VRYNIVRRPLSGGKGSIVRREATLGSRCNLKSCRVTPSLDCAKCGGTGRIGAKPAETEAEFCARLSEIIGGATGPEWGVSEHEHFFFIRFRAEIGRADVEKFRRECLDPILECACDDFEWWRHCKRHGDDVWNHALRAKRFPWHVIRHFRLPFGIYNPIAEGGSADLDAHLETGSTVGLQRTDNLFPELTEGG